MTDAPSAAPRSESTGQFQSSEPLTGRAGLEKAAGFEPMPKSADKPDDFADAKEAAAELIEKRKSASDRSGMAFAEIRADAPANRTMNLDQAVDMLADSREADAMQAKLDSNKALQAEVDALRGKQPADAQQPQIETEADIDRALNHPKVRDAITAKVTEAETQRAAYEAGVRETTNARIAALVGQAPELANLPLNQWAAAITAMSQREPERARQVLTHLQALAAVEAASQQLNAQKTAKEQADMREYASRENARFRELTKGIAPREMAAVQAEIPHMLKEYGVTNPRQFLEAIQGQSTFPRASAERIMVDAAKYRLMQKAAKAIPARAAIPQVQRPGVAGSRSVADSNLASLNAKLNQTGSVKDAAALLKAQRSRRR
jgi:hypothetical protein